MAPARTSARRGAQPQNSGDQDIPQNTAVSDPNVNSELFIDPMLGTPLAVYIEKDVDDKEELVRLVTAYGGTVSPGYSGVTYILVDPHKTSGQNLFRQYAGKKAKIVLGYRWIRECIRANQLQTFSTNWAGCKVTGEEQIFTSSSTSRTQEESTNQTQTMTQEQPPQPQASTSVPTRPVPQAVMTYSMHPMTAVIVDPMNGFPHTVYAHPMHPPPHGMNHSAHPWHAHPHMPGPIPPHMIRTPHPQPYREDQTWDHYHQTQDGIAAPHATYAGEYRYRETHPAWMPSSSTSGYYDPNQYDPSYAQATYMQEAAPVPEPEPAVDEPSTSTMQPGVSPPVDVGPSTGTLEPPERGRGRKRTRIQHAPAPAAETLVNRSAPARSPTPPTRVIKSTYGGNLFTADDVLYLKKYIDFCQEQGLVLSLREICERVAVKAPHHTFYSWRRYCNKHQIRLGGYVMSAVARSSSPTLDDDMALEIEEEATDVLRGGPGPSTSRINTAAARSESSPRNRSPTPPRALYRSTTGKGVAFTQEDINFLMKLLKYRESQGRVDMIQFWKDVAHKAPHHSRASWMKFWRRHKHELVRAEDDEPPPPPPDKKMRYSREDDILLAKYFYEKHEGTSDKLFQSFARLHSHHPWKGWQEHHRIHKAKIDHLVQLLTQGRSIDDATES